ncbi:alpha/beta hydrolase [Sedimentitalea arenosa]|uniref:Alpha/beta hydrolase n=1 Tax=Sedimentitalea arenosa TaxID=2798803 RepID=A0A8J7LXE0_9RHOB|nr:alpha/beta hydrolase [Arenibacterium arenosum]MBJ6373515.1 alpha/beta hydrolase [Arenibacterium arenosum]
MTAPDNYSLTRRQFSTSGGLIQGLKAFGIGVSLLLQSACGEAVYDQIELMPPPVAFKAGTADPLPNISEADYQRQTQLFYVTDRRPATPDETPNFYANDRGFVLRAGIADVVADPPFSGLEELRAASRSGEGREQRSLRIARTKELGVLPVSNTTLLPDAPRKGDMEAAGRAFAKVIDQKLSETTQKDVFIYVHGYNVDFDYPVLTAKELQHYLGYRGAFIVYAWPSTPNRFAYFKDLETADATRRNLRELIDFLSRQTDAENIHIIGYSAGARLAFEAVHELALKGASASGGSPHVGQLILIGSELDRTYFAQALGDGLLDQVDDLTIYGSETDSALGVSTFVLGRQRLGQIWPEDEFTREVETKLLTLSNLHLIDVSDAEESATGNGHGYFRSSPWASSDIILSLIHDKPPQQRGLVRPEGSAIWEFPPDYPDRVVRSAGEN